MLLSQYGDMRGKMGRNMGVEGGKNDPRKRRKRPTKQLKMTLKMTVSRISSGRSSVLAFLPFVRTLHSEFQKLAEWRNFPIFSHPEP